MKLSKPKKFRSIKDEAPVTLEWDLTSNDKIQQDRTKILSDIDEKAKAKKKKRKLEESEEKSRALQPPVGKLRLEMPNPNPASRELEMEKDGEANRTAMISPESITVG